MNCFKAYDIRGRVPDELNENIACRVGRAYAEFLKPSKVIIGRDVRLESAELSAALAAGLMEAGVDVFDIGLCGTEEVYFTVFNKGMDGGIMVTASHNPMDYNGMKLVREGPRPISGDTGLLTIKKLVEKNLFPAIKAKGRLTALDNREAYIRHLLGYVDTRHLKPLRVVVNAGNGCAGPVIDLLAEHLPFEVIRVNHRPDGTFPNGIPNPLLPENRDATAKAVIEHRADAGVAWDGDFDRCFFFDEKGDFIEGYYIVGLLASAMLLNHPGAKIIHDPRLIWNTIDLVRQAGGIPVKSKTGHAFIKERMRAEDAVYGGEMSAHHYFRDFAYCDSGMIPWLLVLEIMSRSGQPLSGLVGGRICLFPASGEINLMIGDPESAISQIKENYLHNVLDIDHTDGLSMEFEEWRFNLRPSNTEPVVRLNVESKGDEQLMWRKTDEILSLMGSKKLSQS